MIIASLFAAAALAAAPNGNAGVTLPLTPPAAAAIKAADGQVMVCKQEAVTGTRFTTHVCKTKDQWVEETRVAREYVDHSTTGCHSSGC